MGKRTIRTRLLGIGLLALAACSGTPATAPKPPTSETANTDTSAKKVAAAPIEKAAPQEEEEALPSNIGSLFQFVGKDTPLIIHIPRLDAFLNALDAEAKKALLKTIEDGVAQKSPFESKAVQDLLSSFDGAVAFSDPGKDNASNKETADATCIAAKFRDPKGVETLLSSKSVERKSPARFQITNTSSKEVVHGVWLANSGVLLGCMSKAALSTALNVAMGKTPSFTTSPAFAPDQANDFFLDIDLHPIAGKVVEPGSRLHAGLTSQNGALALDLRLNAYGPSFPALGAVLDPSPQTTLSKMPKGTTFALGISIKRQPGKTIASILDALDRTMGGNLIFELESGARKAGIELNDLENALGDDIAIALYRDPKQKLNLEKEKGLSNSVLLVAIATKDESAQQKLWSSLTAVAKKKPKDVSIKGNLIENTDPKRKEDMRIESRKGMILLAVGAKSLVKEATAKVGKDTLAKTPTFTEARNNEKPTLHALAYLDGATLKTLLDTSPAPAPAPTPTKTPEKPAFLTLLLGPTDRGLELTLGGNGTTDLLSTLSTIALAGIKNHEADAKTIEAKMNVRFIASYAAAAYERESPDTKGKPTHKLCKTALPVPTTIPKATSYKTNMSTGGDWDSGDEETGWKCLHFFTNEETHYQLEYRQGGNYKGPTRGGPNPGKNGFEVSAEGDLDGDGKTSLFTRTGKITNGKLTLDQNLFESDPTE